MGYPLENITKGDSVDGEERHVSQNHKDFLHIQSQTTDTRISKI